MLMRFENFLITVLRAANLLQPVAWLWVASMLASGLPGGTKVLVVVAAGVVGLVVAGGVAVGMQALDSLRTQEQNAVMTYKSVRSLNDAALRLEKRLATAAAVNKQRQADAVK